MEAHCEENIKKARYSPAVSPLAPRERRTNSEKPSKQKASSPPPLTHLAALSPPDMTAQSLEQSSRIKGHRRAAGREDSSRKRGPSGHTAEKQQQPRGGRIAVSGDERQGQCGSQQADRGEEAAEICDTSPPVPTALSPLNPPEKK
ncbi:hypothetical protein Q8A73_015008 [Channa argus]|nr:hypothetical protein Q8A73_015008 [Channa argus]